jgi:hypothetical protein
VKNIGVLLDTDVQLSRLAHKWACIERSEWRFMEYDELKKLTAGVLDLSDVEFPEESKDIPATS